jgi:DnaJ-class molecular chaperone
MRDLQIPPGIQPGERVKMSGMGVPNINKPSFRGDHHFIVNVLIPKNIRSVSFYYLHFFKILYTSLAWTAFDFNSVCTFCITC